MKLKSVFLERIFYFFSEKKNYNYYITTQKRFAKKEQNTVVEKLFLDIFKSREKKYCLGRQIGKGGFGFVYKAYDKILNRNVAVKFGVQNEFIDSEAQIQGALNHPNIVQVYDFVKISGIFYIIMELVEGQNIRSCCNELRKKNNFFAISKLFLDLCDGMSYLNEKNILHQDIKPQNLMVVSGKAPKVKILDFGIAKEKEETIRDRAFSLRYCSPERFKRNIKSKVTIDIYSFGATLYECLTGQFLNDGQDEFDICRKSCIGELSNFDEFQHIDKSLISICEKCFELEEKNRYQCFKDVFLDLYEYITQKEEIDCSYLYIVDSDDQCKKVIPIKKRNFSIGRAFSNDFVILDDFVSRLHVIIYLNDKDNNYYIKNYSFGGIFVNDNLLPAESSKKIYWGDKIKIGNVLVKFIPSSSIREQYENYNSESLLSFNKQTQIIPSCKKIQKIERQKFQELIESQPNEVDEFTINLKKRQTKISPVNQEFISLPKVNSDSDTQTSSFEISAFEKDEENALKKTSKSSKKTIKNFFQNRK